ncbi:MAG TPA: gluconate 2-dehydrogenase subunit 3 family protein [Solirubrobacterales bacterium]|nr:gluconate 2-dehydrogenase subunit 3 family protein [Solirubrobacterales bacterium]
MSDASHLPNHGGAEPGGGPPGLPRQRRGTTPQMHGRYPEYDLLEETSHWDEETRRVVLDRVERVPSIRFFDEREVATLGCFCDVVMAQDAEPRIPVLARVDEKLFEKKADGYRYADMPPDPDVWREIARMLDDAAAEQGAESFGAAERETQLRIVQRFSEGELRWEGCAVDKAWGIAMRDILSAFYSHPWAWNEIGFGGPAYPRGYARLGPGQREHWESPPEFELDPVRDVPERGLE